MGAEVSDRTNRRELQVQRGAIAKEVASLTREVVNLRKAVYEDINELSTQLRRELEVMKTKPQTWTATVGGTPVAVRAEAPKAEAGGPAASTTRNRFPAGVVTLTDWVLMADGCQHKYVWAPEWTVVTNRASGIDGLKTQDAYHLVAYRPDGVPAVIVPGCKVLAYCACDKNPALKGGSAIYSAVEPTAPEPTA